MAIVKMNRFTLLTFANDKDNLLKALQRFGGVQFKNLQQQDIDDYKPLTGDSSDEAISYYESELAKAKFVLKKIEPYVVKPSGLKGLTEKPRELSYDEIVDFADSFDYTGIYESVRDKEEALKQITQETNRITAVNNELSAWTMLDTSVNDLDKLKSVNYFIGTIPKSLSNDFKEKIERQFECCHIELLNSVKDEQSCIVIVPSDSAADAAAALKNAGFIKSGVNFDTVPTEALRQNNDKIRAMNAEAARIDTEIAAFAPEYKSLLTLTDSLETNIERSKAARSFMRSNELIAMEGWVPQDRAQQLDSVIKGVTGENYYLEMSEVDKDSDDVPIALKNNKFFSAFEGLTEMYSLPKYNQIDPTSLFAPFYTLFFGLMLGDFGYGIILFVGTLIGLKYFNLKPSMRKFFQFFNYLGIATFFAGLLYGGTFGYTVFTPLRAADGTPKPILDTSTDVMLIIGIALALGLIQIVYALLVKAYVYIRDGKPFEALCDSISWLLLLLCALVFGGGAAGVFPEAVKVGGMYCMYASMVFVVYAQGREGASFGGKLALGLYGLYGFTGYIGDLISYIRILALALSGAYIAMAFKLMASIVPEGIMRLLFGTLLIILGNVFNLALGALGAYVHSARLQYVEFFNKFYDGGGLPFKPFAITNNYTNIKEEL